MKRVALPALAVLLVAVPRINLGAQDTTSAQRRAQTAPNAAATQQYNSPLEQLVAEEAQRRANIARILLLTNTQVANQQEALKLLSDQLYGDEALVYATRDQLTKAAEALKKQPSTLLVVLFAADSASAAGVSGLSLSIDGANTASKASADTLATALRVGGAAEMFRGAVLPMSHNVVLSATVNGQPQLQTIRVSIPSDAVTYVQFAMQQGKLIQTTWASRGTNPF
jgi:hypothetical protein